MTGPEDAGNPDVPEEEPSTIVSRDPARTAKAEREKRRNFLLAGGVVTVLAAGLLTALLMKGSGETEPAKPVSTSMSTSTTAVPTTTSIPIEAGVVMPLTGVAVDPADEPAVRMLNRPALAVKVDNDPAATPQVGLDKADVVIELRVEGISRYIAVFHSQDVEIVGPVRSARTGDPDLLAMFGQPLFAWSGGNKNVTKVIRGTPWIQNLGRDQLPAAYGRTKAKKAPHNLIAKATQLFDKADQPPVVPPGLFSYLAPEQEPGGLPTPGFNLHVGSSPLAFKWDGEAGGWRRWSNGRRHVSSDDKQIVATNVVVLQTNYRRSAADSRSPEAESIGGGTAWVFTQGRVTVGTWHRDAREQPWQLLDSEGQPMLLTPGSTWVEMPDPDAAPQLLDESSATQLLSS